MLNELYQVVTALEKRGVPLVVPHAALEPMGKRELLLIELDDQAIPKRLTVLPGEEAGKLARVAHGSEGSSFPGFNLPLPLRYVDKQTELSTLVALVEAQRSNKSSGSDIAKAVTDLFPCTTPTVFSNSQVAQFRRSVQELVDWLRDDFANSGPELENFRKLIRVVANAKLELSVFAETLATSICQSELGRHDWAVFAEILFGRTYRPKGKDPIGSERYWQGKKIADEILQFPVFLDLADQNTQMLPVADPRTVRQLNEYLLSSNPLPYVAASRRKLNAKSGAKRAAAEIMTPDAYTGVKGRAATSFPDPKLALLGNTKLFSNNTTEAACFFRYGLGDAKTFKVSAELVQRMAGAIFTLAGDDLALTSLGGRPSFGRTCRGIPSNRKKKQDLLIAYLENEPEATDPYVELFGSAANSFEDPDFAAMAKPVLEALEGKVLANPNQLIRLIAIASLDKGNNQVTFNRGFTVSEVINAAQAWQEGAANCPRVTLPFFDKQAKKAAWRGRTVPSPLEIATVLNRVWSSTRDGVRSEFQRAISVSDAYDIFMPESPSRESKTRFALHTLLVRMWGVFAAAGRLKATSDFSDLNEPARWQVLKAVALAGIFLHQLNQQYEVFMKDSIYQVGRILALADSLHFEYCKWVRTSGEKRKQGKVDAPGELIGNALFASALDQPKRALARLAERIKPYQGWAKTYSGEDDWKGRWFLRLMSDCERQIDLTTLPERMQDIDKANLLLGYLADNPKSKPEGE